MCPVFRSPSTRSVEAAITPARLDELGRAELAETTPPGPRHDLQRALGAVAAAIALGLVAVWFAVDEQRAVFLVALVAGLLLVMVAAWLNDRSLRLGNRVSALTRAVGRG